MKLHCMCCGKEFEVDDDKAILWGGARANGKTVLNLIKQIETHTCSKKCALHLSKLVYDHFYNTPE